MSQLNLLSISMLAAALSLTACGSDSDSDDNTTTLPDVVEQQQTISGIITDAIGSPLNGAVVTIGNQSVITSSKGAYSAKLTDPKSKTVALIKKTGYLTTAREIVVLPKQSYKLDVALSADQVTTAFASSAGVNQLLVSGAKISIPANAIVNADGSIYIGTVNIAANYYNPDSLAGARSFAQPFAGQDADGSDRTDLVTVGVIDVKLTDSATGAELDLKKGTTATLVYPEVSTDQDLPSIPLWYYDEVQTIWVKDGNAVRQADGSYKGEVSHFTLWNLDIPVNEYYALLEGCIIDATTKLPYTKGDFIGRIKGRGFFNSGGADAKGKFSIKVPFNTPLLLSPSNYSVKFDQIVIPALAQNATYQINGGNCIEISAANSNNNVDLNGNSFDELPLIPVPVTPTPSVPESPFQPPAAESIAGLIGYNFDFDSDFDANSDADVILENILLNILSAKQNNVVESIENSLYKNKGYSGAEGYDLLLLTPQGIATNFKLSVTNDKKLKTEQLGTTFNNNQYTQRLSNGFVLTQTYTDVALSGQKIGDVFDFENNDDNNDGYYISIPYRVIENLNNLPDSLNTFNSSASCKKLLTTSVNMDYIQLNRKVPNLSFDQAIASFGNSNSKRETWAGIPWVSEIIADNDRYLRANVNYNNDVYASLFIEKEFEILREERKDNCEFYNEAAKKQILEAVKTAYPTL